MCDGGISSGQVSSKLTCSCPSYLLSLSSTSHECTIAPIPFSLDHYSSFLTSKYMQSTSIFSCLTCGVEDAHWASTGVVLGYFHPLTHDQGAGMRWAWLAGRAALSLHSCDYESRLAVGVGTLDHGAVDLSRLPRGPPCGRSAVEKIFITASRYELLVPCFPFRDGYYTA